MRSLRGMALLIPGRRAFPPIPAEDRKRTIPRGCVPGKGIVRGKPLCRRENEYLPDLLIAAWLPALKSMAVKLPNGPPASGSPRSRLSRVERVKVPIRVRTR